MLHVPPGPSPAQGVRALSTTDGRQIAIATWMEEHQVSTEPTRTPPREQAHRATAASAPPAQPAPPPRRRRGIIEQIRIGLLVLIGVALLLFILLNYDRVEVQLLFWDPQLRLAWALLGAAFLGFVAGWLVPRLPSRRR